MNLKKFPQCCFVSFVVVFFVLSCENKPSGNLLTININDALETGLDLSEIANDIIYIPLANDSLLEYIMKAVQFKDEFYVTDNKSNFFRFNEKGVLLNPIGRRGRGPGEYRYVDDFEINPKTGHVFISGGKPDQLMQFSNEGEFIKSIDLSKKYINSIGMSEENLVLFYFDGAEHNKENMELLGSEGDLIKSYQNKYEFQRGKAIVSFYGECIMYNYNDKLHFKEIFSDTIFYLEGETMIPEIILNSGNKGFTPEIRTKVINETSIDPRAVSESLIKSVKQQNLFESGNFIFYSFGYNRKSRMLIYNKSTGETVAIDNKRGITNDLDGGPQVHLKMGNDNHSAFSWISAFELIEYVASDAFKNSTPKYPEKKKELERLANSLNENDNPVLMLVKLKD